ncbi:CRISPR-associated helicase Cas3' [Methanosarcina sp. Z-7115]|uniref:CRISPR-associated helicase Cas3 n=1 Tax=Methanosarcina baikalica TaxID=3073890 RepID=A0ABU2CZU1_9EURY|nr:CRISPR-associated helicase Cas3' [Methanosarcina sp. Z-7115]MDR7665201.1 CRISPR-associated helicase Cas3' [Methanosarcina sp. Z-7115]
MEHILISHSLDNPLKLYDHITQVSKASKYLLSNKLLNFNGISKKQIEDLSVLIAVSHDFGKSTSFFQEYILSKVNGTKYIGKEENKSHSLISAFFGWYMTEKWISKNPELEDHWKHFLPFAVFVAIEGHHGKYKSIDDVLNTIDSSFNLLNTQINNVIAEIFTYEFSGLELFECDDFSIETIESIGSKLRKFDRKYKGMNIESQIEHRILALLLYSVLLESDKAYLALDDPQQYNREPIDIPSDIVDNYLKTVESKKSIDEERNKAYTQTISSLYTFPLNERIHSITLPTGLGKTLLSASWALKLRDRINTESGFLPKIIVSLPFLSIIEQTDKIYKEFLAELYQKHQSKLYMPRYSIADFEYKNGIDNKELSDNSIDFFLNVWNSEIIVSTFDQLLYSLFSLKAKHLMRFHNLFNSIIVFDEIQALPSDLWKPFEYFFKKIAEVGNSHILLMSATQPDFFQGPIERVPNHESYFKDKERVTLNINPTPKSVEDFISEIPSFLDTNSDKSLMIVLNTKKSSKLVFKKIKDMIETKQIVKRPILYLSSLVAPSQRSKRILKMKDLLKEENPLIVTTQCIEAGVDIDVDYIIRDWAPLDSIFQVCGRCNRNGEKSKGVIEIIRLKSDKDKLFAESIYDEVLLDCTAYSMKNSLSINEGDFYEHGKEYFELVKNRLGRSMKIVEAFAQYTHKYNNSTVSIKKLLRGDVHQEQFIVSSLDDELPAEIRNALSIQNRWERRYKMKRLGKRIAANSISVEFERWTPLDPDDITKEKIKGLVRVLDTKFYDVCNVGLDVDLKNTVNHTLNV